MMTRLKMVALATLALSSLTAIKPAAAALFSKVDLDPNKLLLVASPYGNNAHQLVIVEQVSNRRACWSESGSSPTTIDPLLTSFDFTGICGRSTDANGYSIRMGDQDLGLQYSLRVVRRDGDLLLVGVPSVARNATEIPIGRAGGVTNGFAKLNLNPGWRITRRVYNNKQLGHFYLTNDQPLNSAIAAAPTPLPATRPLPATQPIVPIASRPTPVRPEIVFAPGVAPSVSQPASPSVPIAVPLPEPTIATGSRPTPVRPLPVTTPSATIPVTIPITIPVSGNRAPEPTVRPPALPTRSPLTGRPIRVPLPAAAAQPIQTAPSQAVQPPVPVAPVVQPPVKQPSVTQPSSASNLPKPTTSKPGNFVVPTIAF
ncbi:DUF3747 domain-containing protein [Phormidium sp. FACHB-592]|uniref:DUF3747 domain-containing protein n=1 Tax=Stenomitos frigidus AS-A4 TaxID=2933935 RepID=A0ABV0KKG6_9CYAN|nr:DUF3747 domain-containing protein [Phormidium sp. FACHB-592]MBD2072804.1 DUF3747 domain-containing protein [Phormidium sp. FACHB-592]